jgi:hypothetical protein
MKMLQWRAHLLLAALSICACEQAAAQCDAGNHDVGAYLHAHSELSVVTLSDLPEDDQALWKKAHGDSCPGMVAVDLDGTGRRSFALALLQRVNGKNVEQLVMLTGAASNVLVEPTDVISPFVVWRANPGRFPNLLTGADVHIPHESIVYEKIEATSTLFYRSHGKIRSLLASD